MRIRSGLKTALVAVLILGTTAILWSFLSRSRALEAPPPGELLAPEISRASTDFDYSEYEAGERLFRVRSSRAIFSADGVHHLTPVQLVLYDEMGEPSDQVSGEEALYEVENRKVEFASQVEIQLQEGTRILSDQLGADLESEILRIEHGFRFFHGDVQGAGKSMFYRIPEKLMEVEGDFRFGVPSETNGSEAGADRGLYDLSGNKLTLRGEAWIRADEFRLESDSMEIFLTEARRIERIVALGGARFESRFKAFSGQQMNLFFQPEEKHLRYFEVLGGGQGPGDEPLSPATYREELDSGTHSLEADRIWGVPDSERPPSEALVIREFRAQENVLFRSTSLGIDESRADTLTANFAAAGNLRHLEMRGGVSVLRKDEVRREQLKSRLLSFLYGPDQWLETVRAVGDVDVRIDSSEESQRLSAKDEVLFRYLHGKISRIISRRARLTSTDEAGRRTLRSPLIVAHYREGVIERVIAQNGAEVEFEEGGRRQQTQSRTLMLSYEEGKMTEAVQSGDFRLRQSDPGGRVALEAQRAVFDPASQKTLVTGSASPRLRRSQAGDSAEAVWSDTVAERFEIDRLTGRVQAWGKVQTILEREEAPLRIWAGRMQFDPESGWIDYDGHPRIKQGMNLITGGSVRLNHFDQDLVVEKEVESSLVIDEGGEPKQYELKADRLRFRQPQRIALYEGDVVVSSEDLSLQAPWVELHFQGDTMDNLSEVKAWGGVEIEEAGRKALGEKAFYHPADKKVRVVGDNAQVIDSKQGKAFGRQLTFYLGDDRLIVEGPLKP